MRSLETTISRLHTSRTLGWSRGRKCFPSALWPLEISHPRPHQSRILGLSRGKKWLLSAIRPLVSKLYRIKKVAFSVGQEAENDFKVPFDNVKHRFFHSYKTNFGLVKRQKMSFQCLATTRKVAFFTSPKSHFGLDHRPKMRWKCHASPWNIVSRPHPNRILDRSRGWKWVRSAWRPLETSLY